MVTEFITRGIEAEEAFKRSFGGEIDKLLEMAPSDAAACTRVAKLGKGYMGELHINSSQGSFAAMARGFGLNDVIRSLISQSYSHIEKWRAQRFTDETPGWDPALRMA